MGPKFICNYEFNGQVFKIEFFGISYRCAELGIYGERSELSCKNSIKRKLKKQLKTKVSA